MKNKIVYSLDIGSSKICAVCASFSDSGKIDVLATETVASAGVETGKVVDTQKVASSIKDVFRQLRKVSGIKPRRIYVNIDSPDLRVRPETKELSLDRRIIYTNNVRGKSAAVSVFIPTVNSVIKSIRSSGLILAGLLPSGCAQSLAFFSDTEDFQKKRYILIDIGAGSTKISLFNNGLIEDIIVVPFGAQSITEDISAKLKLSSSAAEEIKRKHARVSSDQNFLNQRIMIKDRVATRIIYGRQLHEVVLVGVGRILDEIKKALTRLDCDYKEVDELVISGGGAVMEGVLEKAERVFGTAVKMGFIQTVNNRRIQVQSALYATSIGLVRYGLQNKNRKVLTGRRKSLRLKAMANWAGDLYRDYF